MTKPKRIFIVGHMGAGKARLGEALAEKLGWRYIDANPSLERYIGRSLHEILGTQGEEVATLTIESISVEEDVKKIIKALEE